MFGDKPTAINGLELASRAALSGPVKAVVLESCSRILVLLRGPSVVELTGAVPTGGDRCGR